MTLDSLKQACGKINVTFNGNLIFYHKEVIGRYYYRFNHSIAEELMCDVISISESNTDTIYELNDENEIVKCLVKAIKYFKKRENEIRLERINDDF